MRFFSLKLTVIILVISLLMPSVVFAVPPSPPKIPALFYGELKIDDQSAPINTKVSIHKKLDNTEIVSGATGQTGKYFLEVPCADFVGQTMVFRIDGLITGKEYNCVDVMVTPSVNLNLNFNSANQTVENTTSNINIPAVISDNEEVKITFTTASTTGGQTTASVGNDGLILARESTVPANKFTVTFPSNTIITGNSAWDGTLIAPTISNISIILPVVEGKTSEMAEVINIGFTGQTLTFDRPVSILFPGMAGKLTGYSRTGSDFTEITNICSADNGNSLAGDIKECKFNRGADLVVWTKHFTYFAVFSQNAIPTAGGGGGIPLWLLQQQQPKPVAPKVEATPAPTAPTPQVLGEKIYIDGMLLRGKDKKIYVIKNSQKSYISNSKELAKYAGQKIYDVENIVLIQYPEVLGIKVFSDNMLIRGSNAKIYVIKNSKKQHVSSLEELRKDYFGKKIYDVSAETLVKY